jgi:cation diffusion facilitator family transporter
LSLAARPPDLEHPYGHGRIETLAGLAVGFILVIGGIGICVRSLDRVSAAHPPPPIHAVWPLVAAIGVRSGMATVKLRVGRPIGSTSLLGDAWNDAVDVLAAPAALAALGLTLIDPERFLAADHYGGFAVGIVVTITGLRVSPDASLHLMDTMPDPRAIERIRGGPGVQDVEKCFAPRSGLQYHVDLHIEVDPELTVRGSHDLATAVRSGSAGSWTGSRTCWCTSSRRAGPAEPGSPYRFQRGFSSAAAAAVSRRVSLPLAAIE